MNEIILSVIRVITCLSVLVNKNVCLKNRVVLKRLKLKLKVVKMSSVASNSSMEVESGSGGGGGGDGCGDDSSVEACVIKDEIEDTCSSSGAGGCSRLTASGDHGSGKFVLPNELYKSLLASAVLGKTVLGRHHHHPHHHRHGVSGSLNSALDSALKELKDIKGLSVSSVPAFPRNLAALRRDDYDEVCSLTSWLNFYISLSATSENTLSYARSSRLAVLLRRCISLIYRLITNHLFL